ncbi:MAG: flavodoxin domain-containing protein, partial [Clostridium celatum]|nr:flavodoxin domain-containing protein [Clostridium celatum]
MKKVSIIYWSNGGNVEIMANAIAEGASIGDVEVETKNVADSSLEDVLNSDAVAFGSPAMINDEIEEIDMKPFIESLKGIDINNKPLVLFGSCGWRET